MAYIRTLSNSSKGLQNLENSPLYDFCAWNVSGPFLAIFVQLIPNIF